MRDRIVLMCVLVAVVLGAAWMLVVSPERKQAGKLASQVSEAQTQLQTAEGQLANARQAQSQYASAYSAIVSLGKAVPTTQQVSSLIYELAQVSGGKHVDLASITAGSGNASSTPAAASAAGAGFSQLPFTFVFEGGFGDLEHLFRQLDGFATRTASGHLQINGRLLTIQSIKLGPLGSTSTAASSKGAPKLSGTVTATAYVLPASQTLTAGGTAAAPAGTAPAATPAGSAPTAPAIAKVVP